MLVKNEGAPTEGLDQRHVASNQVHVALRANQASRSLRDVKRVLKQNTRFDVIQDLEVVHKFGALLRVVQSWQDVVLEELFDTEVSLEVTSIERIEVVVQTVGIPRLRKREVLIVSELAEVLSDDVFKIV